MHACYLYAKHKQLRDICLSINVILMNHVVFVAIHERSIHTRKNIYLFCHPYDQINQDCPYAVRRFNTARIQPVACFFVEDSLAQDILTSQAPQVDATSTVTYNVHHRAGHVHFHKSLSYFLKGKIVLYQLWTNWTNAIFNSEKLHTLCSDLHHFDSFRSEVQIIQKRTQQRT